jgi:RNA polymerase sigma factor (sigma-70 family)
VLGGEEYFPEQDPDLPEDEVARLDYTFRRAAVARLELLVRNIAEFDYSPEDIDDFTQEGVMQYLRHLEMGRTPRYSQDTALMYMNRKIDFSVLRELHIPHNMWSDWQKFIELQALGDVDWQLQNKEYTTDYHWKGDKSYHYPYREPILRLFRAALRDRVDPDTLEASIEEFDDFDLDGLKKLFEQLLQPRISKMTYQQAELLRVFYGLSGRELLSVDEIAEIFNLSPSQVHRELELARRNLRHGPFASKLESFLRN